jgi:hypothetical protein
MARWFTKRWVWAALAGATVTVGMSVGRGEEPPKAGSTIALPIDGKTDRQFKVIKTEKQSDGTYLSELKDVKTGEALTLLTRPDDPPKKPPADDSKLPKAKVRMHDPMVTPISGPAKDPEKEKDRHPLLHRIFGDRDKDKAGGAGAMPATDPAPEAGKKPGIIGRIFGPKKPSGPSMPPATMTPPIKVTSPTPPPVLPVPPGGLTADKVPVPSTAPPVFPTTPPATSEPPRVMPSRPQPPTFPAPMPPFAAPIFPTPAFPVPSAPPVPTPMPAPSIATPVPAPFPMPPIATPVPAPIPVVPPLPAPPTIPVPPVGGSGLPAIPIPPGGTSATRPLQVIVPVGYVSPQLAYDRDVQPFAIALQTMTAPSARLSAAKGLAEGRHCSTDGVKSVLFRAAQRDPCGEVRAACITHLCNLGYFTPHFLAHIQAAREDADPLVRDAATAACEKMIRK